MPLVQGCSATAAAEGPLRCPGHRTLPLLMALAQALGFDAHCRRALLPTLAHPLCCVSAHCCPLLLTHCAALARSAALSCSPFVLCQRALLPTLAHPLCCVGALCCLFKLPHCAERVRLSAVRVLFYHVCVTCAGVLLGAGGVQGTSV